VNALDSYREAPLRARVHVTGRWRSCPFAAVAEEVPAWGRILDLGCGHGLLAVHLALEAPGRRVTGVEVDADKLAVADAAATRAGVTVELRLADGARVPAGPWDGIVVVDVLYLLGEEEQRDLVTRLAGTLAPGGVLVVKEMRRRPAWKFAWVRLQELLAVKVLRITQGEGIHFAPDDALPRWMTDAGLEVTADRPVDRGYPYPHRLVVGRRP
jgi:cyclopropane fatty-acyl-phospholipid synthase-like methyltransferase